MLHGVEDYYLLIFLNQRSTPNRSFILKIISGGLLITSRALLRTSVSCVQIIGTWDWMCVNQKVDMPVYAAADGYIVKITVQPFGYGLAIYINHPNGLTTVYGHLNKFFPGLESAVTDEQNTQQSWDIELNFTKDQFPVRKGQFIAWSGSTGGSQGPSCSFRDPGCKDTEVHQSLFF